MGVITQREPELATQVLRSPTKSPEESQADSKLYRTIWRWHFYAGMLVAPILLTAATTGGIYIFKPELERVFYRDLLFVSPVGERASADDQLAAITSAMSDGFEVTQLIVPDDSAHSTTAYGHVGDDYRTLYVDPYRAQLLGQQGPDEFFRVVLKIHRTLFAGTFGRVVVELMTCWTIVLVITGLYLWWPRGSARVWGSLLPRLRQRTYVTLRDLHAVGGAYVAVVALLIASTGLLYTYVWGKGYQFAAAKTGAYDLFLDPPKSTVSPDRPALPLEDVVTIASETMPDADLTVRMPADPSLAYVVFASTPWGAMTDAVAVIDQGSGEVIEHRTHDEFPALAWWATWNYPLHVGSFLGVWSKVPWLLACIILMLLPITGVWMWWVRRPRGTAGLPRRYDDVRVPRGIVAVIVALSLVLPVVGISLAVILSGDRVRTRLISARFRAP